MLHNELKKEFEYLTEINPIDLANILKDVDAVIIANILTLLPDKKNADIIKAFDNSKRVSVITSLVNIKQTKNNDLEKIAKYIKEKVDKYFNITSFNGLKQTVNILNIIGIETEEILLELEKKNPETAKKLKSKIGTIDDILKLDIYEKMSLFGEVETNVLALAFFKTTDKDKEKIFEAMSQRGKQRFLEETQMYSNPTDSDIYTATAKIMNIFNQLVEDGRIELN